MTPQPMTLEETIKRINRWPEFGRDAGWSEDAMQLLASALHHLEAGKHKRYTPQDMIFAAAFGIEKLGENFPELRPVPPTQDQA